MSLSEKEIERYLKHIIIGNIGFKGQEKVSKSKVLVIGKKEWLEITVLYLVLSGIGEIGIVHDRLENLDLFSFVCLPNNVKFSDYLNLINPRVKVVLYPQPINYREIVKDYDFIMACLDNKEEVHSINDICLFYHKPLFLGEIFSYVAIIINIIDNTPFCYRCLDLSFLLQDNTSSLSIKGQYINYITALLQINEMLKYIIGIGKLATDSIWVFDLEKLSIREEKIEKNKYKECPACDKYRDKKK